MSIWIETAFQIAGLALITHLVFCMILRRRLRDHEGTVQELFAVSNGLLGGGGPRLLRMRYYWPWTRVAAIDALDANDRVILSVTRVSGLVMPLAVLAFLAMSVAQAGSSG
jgi:hypothetical protein